MANYQRRDGNKVTKGRLSAVEICTLSLMENGDRKVLR